MKHSLHSKVGGVLVVLIASIFFLNAPAFAQTDYYFDPGLTDTQSSPNGTGTWNTNTTANWFLPGTGDVKFPNSVPTSNPNDIASNPANANFDNSGGGTVTVSGTVNPYDLTFAGGNYDVDGTGLINFNFPISTGYYAGGFGGAFLNVNSGNVTFNAPIDINATAGDPANKIDGAQQFGFRSVSSGTVTYNNTTTFNSPGGVDLNIFTDGTGKTVFTGSIVNATNPGTLNVTTTGTFEFDGTIGGQIVAENGTVLLDKGTGVTGMIAQSGAVLTNGAITVASGLNTFSRYGGTFGGATADESHFESTIQNYNGVENLVAAAGGKVDFDGELQVGGVNDGTNDNDLVVGGTGIVNFSDPTGNTYGVRYHGDNTPTQAPGSNTDVGTEISSGATLLMSNTSGSATGGGTIQDIRNGVAYGLNNVVQLDAGGTLAGKGYTQQTIVTQGATSTLSPGDMAISKVSSVGILHLDNGLDASKGATLNFDLNGEQANDQIEVSTNAELGLQNNGSATAPLILGTGGTADAPATVTFNFINLGGILDNASYALIYGQEGEEWDINPANFVFNAPAGYAVNYLGIEIDPADANYQSLDVSFEQIPEPSTWALMGMGLLASSTSCAGTASAPKLSFF